MEGVIVVAATNRPEMIDPALMRVGGSNEFYISLLIETLGPQF